MRSWAYAGVSKYCNNSSIGYNGFTDTLIALQPSDDAAMANWGDGWCMPTKDQWVELSQNTTHIWMTQNGVNGRLFTASNGNTLFLPAAGRCWDGGKDNVGSCGTYWSSSLYTDFPTVAWRFFLDMAGFDMDYGDRYIGLSVRAVCSAN